MKKIALVIILGVLVLASCKTPEQKLLSLYEKHPELRRVDTAYLVIDRVFTDTVVIKGDSIYIPNHDTVFETEFVKVFVDKDKIKFIEKNRNIIIHDTIRDSIPVISQNNVPIIKKVEVISDWIRMLIGILCGAIIILLFIKRK